MLADRRVKGTEVFVGGLPRSATEGTLREVGLSTAFEHPSAYVRSVACYYFLEIQELLAA
jgi:hypothetical protein